MFYEKIPKLQKILKDSKKNCEIQTFKEIET